MTMECNKDDALLAKKKAEERFSKQDFVGAKNFLNIAKRLFSSLEGLEQMLAVVDVHITAQTEVAKNEMDWYAILQVDPSADDITIKKQYRKLALALHPDKNKAFGAEAAFKLIGEALGVLSDKGKRSLHDMKRNISNGPLDASTFWTACPICKIEYQYPGIYRNCELLCRLCRLSYVARDIDAHGKSTHIWTQYYANVGTNVDSQRYCANNGMANCAYTTTGQEQVPIHHKNAQSDKACKDKKESQKQELRREKEAQKKAKEEEKRRETELRRREAQRKAKEEEMRRETEMKEMEAQRKAKEEEKRRETEMKERETQRKAEEEKRRETEMKEREAQKKAQEEEKRREADLKRRQEREAQNKAREIELQQRTENEAQKKVKEEQKRREAELKRRPGKKAQQKTKEEEKQRETRLKRRPGKEAQKKVKEEEKLMQTELKQRTGEEAGKKAMEEENRLEMQSTERSEKGQGKIQKSVKERSRKRAKRFKNMVEEKNAKEDDIEDHTYGNCYIEETFKAQRRKSSRVRQNISYKLDKSDDDFDEFPAKKLPGMSCKRSSNENTNKHKRRKVTVNIGIVPKVSSVGKSLSNGKIQNMQLDDNSDGDDNDNDNDQTSSKALQEALMLIKSRLLVIRLVLTSLEKPLFSRIKVRAHCMT